MTEFVDPAHRIEALLDRLSRSYRARIERAVNGLRSRVALERLAKLLAAGETERALQMADTLAHEVAASGAVVYVAAANATSRFLREAAGVVLSFNQADPRVAQWTEQLRLDLVQKITTEQRAILRQALVESAAQGLNPRETAKALGDSLGLTQSQQAAVANYRRLLEAGDPRAARRALHSGAKGEELKTLTPGQIDRMVEGYRRRMIRYRAEVVARTESLRAIHGGVAEMYQQAIDQGVIEDTLVRQWHTARDARVRGHHRSMHGQVREVGVPFISGQGNRLLYPGDPSAPASDVVQCRCVLTTRFAVDQE